MKRTIILFALATLAVQTAMAQSNPASADSQNAAAEAVNPGEFVECYHMNYWHIVGDFTNDDTFQWDNGGGGQVMSYYNSDDDHFSGSWPASSWPDPMPPGTGIETVWGATNWTGTLSPIEGFAERYCDACFSSLDTGETFYKHEESGLALATGGAPGSASVNLWEVSANANGETFISSGELPDDIPVDSPIYAIPYTSISAGVFGYLNAQGNAYKLLPDNATVDVTPYVAGNDHYSFSDPPGEVRLTGLTVVSGAQQIDVTNYAAVKTLTNDWVYLHATLSTDDTNVAKFIQWSAGDEVPWDPFGRRVTKTASAKTTVAASLGDTSFSKVVWIIWAAIGCATSGSNPSPLMFPTNWPCTTGNQLGIQYGSSSNSVAVKVCIIGTATPSGIHTIVPDGWGIVQQEWSHRFKDGTTNEYCNTWTDDFGPGYVGEITHLPAEINTLDNADKFYAIDDPFIDITFTPAIDSWELYDNYSDLATWNGQVCSDTNYWGLQIIWKTNQTPQIISASVGGGNASLPPSPTYPPP